MNVRRRRLTIAAGLIAGFWPNLAPAQIPARLAEQPPKTGAPIGHGQAIRFPVPTKAAPVFYLRSYMGKCLDFGTARPAGTQVYISDCNKSAEQQILVEEVDAQHDVRLHAGALVLGLRPLQRLALPATPPSPAPASPVFVLELQNPAAPSTPSQTFALDGDSIILASNHTLVVQVQNSLVANGSPLVVWTRSLADSEFWDFSQVEGVDMDPTSGFVRVGYPGSTTTAKNALLSAIPVYPNHSCPGASGACATAGTVIQIYPGTDIDLSGLKPLEVPSGVTIRGSRRGTLFGPLLHQERQDNSKQDNIIFEVPTGDHDVRISGLRLQGTSASTAKNQPYSEGVLVDSLTLRTIVDHNDVSHFTAAGVEVRGTEPQKVITCRNESSDPTSRPTDAFIARNFFHHNEMQDDGYGVEADQGGYPLVEANMFYLNRHAIAADGSAHTGYRAWFNLVLEDSPIQKFLDIPAFDTHDFDMHGSGGNGFGGIAGDYVQMNGNTFLGTNRPNFEIRGVPCNLDYFNGNVSLQSSGSAVSVKLSEIPGTGPSYPGDYVNTAGNDFKSSNPTGRLGVGDFDGDGIEDVFLATGAAWYYAPQGSADWRLLSAKTVRINALIFGDFDGDGRTDVATLNGNKLEVSWGGVSDWVNLNTVNASITDLAVGKFGNHARADRRDDILWSNGSAWYISSGGAGPFTLSETSSARVKDLRFGDFDGNGTTDVLGIIAGKWMVSYSANSAWKALPKSLTGTMDGVVVADFDGDGRADIATSTPVPAAFNSVASWIWRFSSAGATDWTERKPTSGKGWPVAISMAAAIGNFDGNRGADVLAWGDDKHLYIVRGGSLSGPVPITMYSREDLR